MPGRQGRADPHRAIIVAHTANPLTMGSVPVIGYRICAGLAGLTEATLIFHARHRADLESRFPAERVIYAGSRRIAEALRRISARLFPERWGPMSIIEFLDYLVFDIDAYRKARRVIRRDRVDFVLRVNPISYRFASVLPRLPVPVFTGPHNGGMRWPPAFSHLERSEKTAQKLRFLGDIMHRVYRDTGRYAGIFVAHELCAQTVERSHQDKVIFFPENGVAGIAEPSVWAGDARRLLYVGRMVPFKAVDVALRALARLPDSVGLTLVGDGPARPELEALAARLGVADRCRFTGAKPQAEVRRYYAEAGVLVFPSVRESGGMVVLEAMSHGLPCLVARWGGPAIYTREVGIHLSVDSPRALEDDLVAAVSRLLADPAEARRVGARSRQAIGGQYLWSQKAGLLLEAIRGRLPGGRPGPQAVSVDTEPGRADVV
jgi:glycosyltransferase involved in cell wall biosynthesis